MRDRMCAFNHNCVCNHIRNQKQCFALIDASQELQELSKQCHRILNKTDLSQVGVQGTLGIRKHFNFLKKPSAGAEGIVGLCSACGL